MQSRELQRKVMKPGETAAVTKCGIVRRFALGLVTLLLFGFTLTPAAQQNQSSPQAHPPQFSETLAEAQSSLVHGNAEEAIRILSSYLQTRPKDSAARTLLGQAYASVGQNERAEEELHGVLQVAPNDSTALAALGEIYEREGQPEKAEPLLANAAQNYPQRPADPDGVGGSACAPPQVRGSTKRIGRPIPAELKVKRASGSTG